MMLVRGIRCYSTKPRPQGQAQTKSVLSFLERMDALYANKGATTTRNVIERGPIVKGQPRVSQLSGHGQSQQKFNRQANGERRPQRRVEGARTGADGAKRPARAQSARQPIRQPPVRQLGSLLKNINTSDLDVMDSALSTNEKLDLHVTPKNFTPGRVTRVQSSRPGAARRPGVRPGMRQLPKKFQDKFAAAKKGGAKFASKAKRTKFSRRGASEKPVGTDFSVPGILTTEETLAVLKRRLNAPPNSFIRVESLSSTQLLGNYDTAATYEGRVLSAARSSLQNGQDVAGAVNHSIKGLAFDVGLSLDKDLKSQSIANALNSHPALQQEFKVALADVVAGRASLSSLKPTS